MLLDISMPVLDGMALARILARDDWPAIVFVTAHGCYAVNAFEIAATDYLLKPVSLQRARGTGTAPVAASAYLAEVWAPRGREMTRVGVDTLDLVEAERDYVRLHAKGRIFLLRTTLRELESRLDRHCASARLRPAIGSSRCLSCEPRRSSSSCRDVRPERRLPCDAACRARADTSRPLASRGRGQMLLADRAYDPKAWRETMTAQGAWANIMPMSTYPVSPSPSVIE